MTVKKPSRKRWVCPLCKDGHLAPSKPRKNNALRYCLPCSGKTGKLVERDCPALDTRRKKKADAKQESAAKKREKTSSKPRRTKRSWMRDKKYIITAGERAFNVMEMAEKMCKSSRWQKAVVNAAHATKQCSRYPNAPHTPTQELWRGTMTARGAGSGIRIGYQTKRGHVSGRGGSWYGVSMTVGPHSTAANVMQTLLHEICHVVHLRTIGETEVNGKRRPHDLAFNLVQYHMAHTFWGYDTHPYAAGYSVGKGYSPSTHMQKWLAEQIAAENPRVMKWLDMEAPAPEPTPAPKKKRNPVWDIDFVPGTDDKQLRLRMHGTVWDAFDSYVRDRDEDEQKTYVWNCESEKVGRMYEVVIDNTKWNLEAWHHSVIDCFEYPLMEMSPSEDGDPASWHKGLTRLKTAIEHWHAGNKWDGSTADYQPPRFRWGDKAVFTNGATEPVGG